MSDPNDVTIVALKSDGDALLIDWSDNVQHRLPWTLIRDSCPCATCSSKQAEPKQLLPVLSVAEAQTTRPTAMSPMGNYAYSIHFNDGHNTGIYSLTLLRRLGENAGN